MPALLVYRVVHSALIARVLGAVQAHPSLRHRLIQGALAGALSGLVSRFVGHYSYFDLQQDE
jgi:hypothetical protein